MDWQTKLDQARDLIQAKEYDEARRILESIAHPVAAQWLKRLDEIAPLDPSNPDEAEAAERSAADQTPPEAPTEPLRRPDPRRESPIQPLKSPPPQRATSRENVIRPITSPPPRRANPTSPTVPTNYTYQRPEMPTAISGGKAPIIPAILMSLLLLACCSCPFLFWIWAIAAEM